VFILPIEHNNASRKTPYVVWTLLLLNIAAMLAYAVLPYREVISQYGYHPSNPSALTALTSMFLHAGLWHLVGNLWFLWMFGDNVEELMGSLKFLAAYFVAGVAALGAHTLTTVRPELTLVGASGAVSGVVGMYFVLQPNARFDLHIVVWRWVVKTFAASAVVATGVWFVEQLLLAVASSATGLALTVAFWAHVGGFAAGVVTGIVFGKFAMPSGSDRIDITRRRFDN
jgi:membrane associated rhomboid family serine protease